MHNIVHQDTNWLLKRVEQLITDLAPLGRDQERIIHERCVAEIEAWRVHPMLQLDDSLNVIMSDVRRVLIEQLPVMDDNSYMDEKLGR
jgi:hypothetical protein